MTFARTSACSLLCLSLAGSAAAQVAGVWDTSFGQMTLRQDGSSVSGSYTTDNGSIQASLANGVLDGIWIEDSSGQRCGTAAPDGRYYWGRVRFWFDASGGFTGAWSYCDAPLGAQGEWNGTRSGSGTAEPSPSLGGYWRYSTTRVQRPTAESLGPYGRLHAADASERGLRLDYSFSEPVASRHAANFDFSIKYPGAMRPGEKITARGSLSAQYGSWSASCALGPASIVPYLAAEEGVKPGATSAGEAELAAPFCDDAGNCPELVVSCQLASSYSVVWERVYEWVPRQ